MDLVIKSLDLTRPVVGVSPLVRNAQTTEAKGFKDALLQALQTTSDLQAASGRLSKEFALDNPNVSLEQTMVAGAKSGIAFQATLQVRNKIVQAYAEIMNMQI